MRRASPASGSSFTSQYFVRMRCRPFSNGTTHASASSSRDKGLGEHSLQETQSVGGDCILCRRQRPPDRGGPRDRLVLDRERLDHQRPLIRGVSKRGRDLGPRDLVIPRSAAVAATGVKVGQVSFAKPDRRGGIVLLDVHVKGVEQYAKSRRGDSVDHLHHLFGRVYEARLESVEWLEGERHTLLAGVVGEEGVMLGSGED